jgi:hypothetical protein
VEGKEKGNKKNESGFRNPKFKNRVRRTRFDLFGFTKPEQHHFYHPFPPPCFPPALPAAVFPATISRHFFACTAVSPYFPATLSDFPYKKQGSIH